MKLKPRLLALALALTPLPALSTPPDPAGITPDADLFELSLEQLMDVVVTSVSKRSQPLSSTAAAVHVISAEDIRRSGAANLPEALRLAPGVHVARFSNNRWSVSIRGFGGRYANKLLVLQDGRSLYSPVYSGVFWEFNDIPLELVERIEVVRGPGASIWGANAVNGVINIITRNAADARGTQLSASAGTTLRGSLFASHGVALSEGTHLEVHAKSQYVEPSSTTEAGPARDFWRTRQAGFRLDGKSGADTFRLQGSARDSVAGDHFMQRTADIDAAARDYNSVSELAYLLGRWEHDAGDGTLHSLQAYAEKSRLDILVGSERRSTFDIEYQQQQRLGARVDFVWGGLRQRPRAPPDPAAAAPPARPGPRPPIAARYRNACPRCAGGRSCRRPHAPAAGEFALPSAWSRYRGLSSTPMWMGARIRATSPSKATMTSLRPRASLGFTTMWVNSKPSTPAASPSRPIAP